MSSIQLDNIGFYKTALTEEQLFPLKQEIEELQSQFNKPLTTTMNARLAGNIAREYLLSDSSKNHLNECLQPFIKSYLKDNPVLKQSPDKPLTLDTSWINFQRKTEFNPVHTHSGILSFVIWVKIPFTNEDEMDNDSVKYSNMPVPGAFSFLYTNSIGQITSHIIKADINEQNTVLIFPSSLNHCVYPFYTSNEYRISVSGNFK